MAIHRPRDVGVTLSVFNSPDFLARLRLVGGYAKSSNTDVLILISSANYQWRGVGVTRRLAPRRFPADLAGFLIERDDVRFVDSVAVDNQEIAEQRGRPA